MEEPGFFFLWVHPRVGALHLRRIIQHDRLVEFGIYDLLD